MEYIKRKEKQIRSDDRRIKLNIGGVIFETWASTLESIQGTRLALLAHLQETDESWDRERQEFFFDRHPGAFTTILHYSRSEELHIDQNICGNIIRGVCISKCLLVFLSSHFPLKFRTWTLFVPNTFS